MIAKDSFIILQSGTELTGALCRIGLKSVKFRICTMSPVPI